MPFILLIIGIVLVVAAIRNQQDPLVALIIGDFSGTGNFFYWLAALILIGAIGYVPRLKPVSDGLLILIILALVLTRGSANYPGGGVFKQLEAALGSSKTPSATTAQGSGAAAGNLAGAAIGNLAGFG